MPDRAELATEMASVVRHVPIRSSALWTISVDLSLPQMSLTAMLDAAPLESTATLDMLVPSHRVVASGMLSVLATCIAIRTKLALLLVTPLLLAQLGLETIKLLIPALLIIVGLSPRQIALFAVEIIGVLPIGITARPSARLVGLVRMALLTRELLLLRRRATAILFVVVLPRLRPMPVLSR